MSTTPINPRRPIMDDVLETNFEFVNNNIDAAAELLDRALIANADLQAKLDRPEGLCTSVAKNGAENLRRMRFILDAWERGVMLEAAPRATVNQWLAVRHDSPPFDFGSTVYRVAQ